MGEDVVVLVEGGHVGWVWTLRGSCGVGEDVLGGYPGKFPKVLSFMKVSGKFNTYQKFLEDSNQKFLEVLTKSFSKVFNQKFVKSFQLKVSRKFSTKSFSKCN